MKSSFFLRSLLFLTVAAATAVAQPESRREVDFGINGHPLNAESFEKMPLEQQIALLKTLGLSTYRVNINPANINKFARLSDLIALAERENIRILPVVVLPPKQYSDEDAAYNAARAATYGMAKQFETQIRVWELGNEYDLYCVKNGASGASPADYNAEKYSVVRGLIRGMLAGLRDVNPSLKSMVETSQHTPTSLDSGFLERLIGDGVTFDITAYHYYSRDGRLPTADDGKPALKVLRDSFRKPIWITEFDQASISSNLGPDSDPKEQGKALTAAMNEIAADAHRYGVIGADIYELLDQPELLQSPSVKPNQAEFGILNAQGGFTDASRAVQDFLRHY